MCIVFLYLAEDPPAGSYAVILANNRDEEWDRPTKSADFWSPDSDCISGLDAVPGREGGTWLGLNTTGKIGALLNVLSSQDESNELGRGFLVSNYLTSKANGHEHLKKLSNDGVKYRAFNLITLDMWKQFKFNLEFYSNLDQEPIALSAPGYHAFGNCGIDHAWRKVDAGKAAFSGIVSEYRTVEKERELLDGLFSLLCDSTRDRRFDENQVTPEPIIGHLPDEYLEKQGSNLPEDMRQQRSAINVWSPSYRCGTRTNTIILIDGAGHCEYVERTMIPPTDTCYDNDLTEGLTERSMDPHYIEWKNTRYSFEMTLEEENTTP